MRDRERKRKNIGERKKNALCNFTHTRTRTYIRKWKKATKKGVKRGYSARDGSFLPHGWNPIFGQRTRISPLPSSAPSLLPSNLYIALRSISYIEPFLLPNYQTCDNLLLLHSNSVFFLFPPRWEVIVNEEKREHAKSGDFRLRQLNLITRLFS